MLDKLRLLKENGFDFGVSSSFLCLQDCSSDSCSCVMPLKCVA